MTPIYGGLAPRGTPGWTPAVESPLAWWYGSSTYLRHLGAGATDGQTADTWLDRSGNSCDVAKGPNTAATYRANGFNTGKPSADFVAATDGYGASPNALELHCSGSGKSWSFFFTLQIDAVARVMGLLGLAQSGGNSKILLEINAAGKLRASIAAQSGSGSVAVGTKTVTTGHHRLAFICDGLSISSWIDGALDMNGVTAPAGALALDNMVLGLTDNIVTPNALDGQLREVVALPFAAGSRVWNDFLIYSVADSGA